MSFSSASNILGIRGEKAGGTDIDIINAVTTDTVNLAVHIPASQAIGLYTGTLTLNMPF